MHIHVASYPCSSAEERGDRASFFWGGAGVQGYIHIDAYTKCTYYKHTHIPYTLTSPHVEVGYCISTASHLVVQKPRLFLAEEPLDKRHLTWSFSFHAGLSKCTTCFLREREWTIPRWEISSSLLPNFPGSPHSGFPRESGYYDSVHDRPM